MSDSTIDRLTGRNAEDEDDALARLVMDLGLPKRAVQAVLLAEQAGAGDIWEGPEEMGRDIAVGGVSLLWGGKLARDAIKSIRRTRQMQRLEGSYDKAYDHLDDLHQGAQRAARNRPGTSPSSTFGAEGRLAQFAGKVVKRTLSSETLRQPEFWRKAAYAAGGAGGVGVGAVRARRAMNRDNEDE